MVENAIGSVPGVNNTPLGGVLVGDLVKAGAQWQLDQRKFIQDWIDRGGGNPNRAATKFVELHPVQDYFTPVLDKYGLTSKGFKSLADIQQQVTDGLINPKIAVESAYKSGLISEKRYKAEKARMGEETQ